MEMEKEVTAMDRDDVNETTQDSADRKGKGKETTFSSQPSSDSASGGLLSGPSSVMARLTSSTTQLAKDLITNHATAVDMAETQPFSKAGPSAPTTSNYRSAADAPIRPLSLIAPALGRNFSSSQGPKGNRSNESGFSAFVDNANKLEPTERRSFGYSQRLDFTTPQLQPRGQINVQADKPVEDGLEVINILESGYDDVIGDPDVPLSAEEQTALRRALFQEDGQWKRKPVGDYQEGNLNFFPDFISNGTSKSPDISNHLGVSDVENARIVWVSHWQDVLSNYNDEVWGDLSHLVEEAREELQALSSSPEQAPISGSGALRRLQQILAHVRRI